MECLRSITALFALLMVLDTSYCKLLNFKQTIGLFSKAESALGPTDFVGATASDLMSVHSATMKLRGEDNAANKESFNQALVALTVLDVGGGALAPVIEGVVDVITRTQYFEATRAALGEYNTILTGTKWSDMSAVDVEDSLKAAKKKVLASFEKGAQNLGKGSAEYKALNSAKNWFKAKSVLKVLGPIFDAATIGVNSWSLHTALRDCNENSCNYGAIYGATLGICSGVVGILTFAGVMAGIGGAALGPVGAVLGLTLGIAGTLVQNYWPQEVKYDAIDYAKRVKTMQLLQKYSRAQLYAANQYLHVKGVTKNDIYVVNQGHLAKIMEKEGNLVFRATREDLALPGQCNKPSIGVPRSRNGVTTSECRYLVSGEEWLPKKDFLGYDFYGFTPETRTRNKHSKEEVDATYKGSTILINTNTITKEELENNGEKSVLKGLDIDTTKGDVAEEFNDLISLSQMKNLDRREKIKIRMGGGDDSLNIDGMFGQLNSNFENILDADLGASGHNALSFMGLQLKRDGIKGIKFDSKSGNLHYEHGNNQNNMHHIGHIKNTELIIASSGKDSIKLFGNKAGQSYNFVVMKFAGKGEYEIDISQFKPEAERKFKIIDGTVSDNANGDDKCGDHTPEILITNLPDDAVPNDILYKGGAIEVHATRKKIRTTRLGHRSVQPSTGFCSGEFEERNGEGGKGKQKIATIFLSTRCPVKIRAETKNKCVINRPLGELDLMFYNGRKVLMDFSQDISPAADGTDVITLHCPKRVVSTQVTFNLAGGDDTIVLRKDTFIDPCKIDGEIIKLIVERNGDEWKLRIVNSEKFEEQEHIIKGAAKVVNEYGNLVFDFSSDREGEVDLFDLYTRQTAQDMIGEKESGEVKKEMLKCMQSKNVINKDAELKEYCQV